VIINERLKKGSISSDTYYGLVGPDTGDKLLGTNVFAFHFNSREISFQSTLIKAILRGKFGPLERKLI